MKTWHIGKTGEAEQSEAVLGKAPGEVKLKISKVAVAAADISYFCSDADRGDVTVPGHSGLGYVSEDDEEFGLKLGARAVVSPYLPYDDHGVRKVGVMGVDRDGMLRDFIAVPGENVYVLPDGISDDEAIFAEYIALGNNVFNHIDSKKGDFIVIVGANTIGLILAQLAVYYQLVPILVDLDADKLELAEKWGVYYTLNPTFDNLERRVEEITGGRMAEFAVYVGESVPFGSAVRLVMDRGNVVVAGYTMHVKHQIDMDTVLKKQLTVKGVANGYGEMSSAINLLANKIIRTQGLISMRAGFDKVPEIVRQCVEYPYQFNEILIESD